MRAPELPWELVGQVARSFALSLRLLPAVVRHPITLAYLLARISDTEADGASHGADRLLLDKKSELLALLASSPDADLIEDVWTTIQEGQNFDRQRFPSAEPLSPSELDRYTSLVAGSVGIFWTRLCARRLTRFSSCPTPKLEPLARQYGKALQLVNILRDRQKDAGLDRIYLPPERVAAAFVEARQGLDSANSYIASLRLGRLRIATALPAMLAAETLDLVERNPSAHHAKIPRSRVHILMAKALVHHGLGIIRF